MDEQPPPKKARAVLRGQCREVVYKVSCYFREKGKEEKLSRKHYIDKCADATGVPAIYIKNLCRKSQENMEQSDKIIYNVCQYFKNSEKAKSNYIKEAVEATGYSDFSIKQLLKEGESSMQCKGKLSFSTPKGKRKPRPSKAKIDDSTKCVIRRKIHEFYTVKKVPPTIKALLHVLKEENVVQCGRETLRKVVKEIGFRWKKCQSKRKFLIERQEIASWRARYLRKIRSARALKKNIIYLDETYIHATHSVPSCGHAEEEQGVLAPIGKGPRLIIIHAGGETGFVPNALLIFKSKQKTGDYHDDMNFENFSNWIAEKFIPNIPPDSVIIMDNTSYHCVQVNRKPTTASLKRDIQNWLLLNKITFNEKMHKPELLDLVKSTPSDPRYLIDDMLTAHGHSVLRLPPYHTDLNPIELVWDSIKGQVRSKYDGQSLERVRELCEIEFSNYTPQQWKDCCKHVDNIEQLYWERDGLLDNEIDTMIISLGDESSSDTDGDTDEDTDEEG